MTAINDGWCYFTNSNTSAIHKVAAESVQWDWKWAPEITHLVNKSGFYYDLQERYLIWNISNIILDTHTKFEDFLSDIETWHDAGYLQFELVYNSGGSKVKCDGTNTKWNVAILDGFKKVQKISPYNGEIFNVGKLTVVMIDVPT